MSLNENETSSTLVRSLQLRDDERFIVRTVFTEETVEEAEDALRERFGLRDARRSIERAVGKVNGNAE